MKKEITNPLARLMNPNQSNSSRSFPKMKRKTKKNQKRRKPRKKKREPIITEKELKVNFAGPNISM